jgi:hypothetical protein
LSSGVAYAAAGRRTKKVPPPLQAALPLAATVPAPGCGSSEDILRTRTYDLLISYNKFFQVRAARCRGLDAADLLGPVCDQCVFDPLRQVPQFWLVGWDEERRPLAPEQV